MYWISCHTLIDSRLCVVHKNLGCVYYEKSIIDLLPTAYCNLAHALKEKRVVA